jgi:hypothetical protein
MIAVTVVEIPIFPLHDSPESEEIVFVSYYIVFVTYCFCELIEHDIINLENTTN